MQAGHPTKAMTGELTSVLSDLLSRGFVEKCVSSPDQFLSPYFLAKKSDGSKRFILNLRDLNKFLNAPHFKLEDYRTSLKLIYPDCFMAKLDLKDAYYSIPIAMEHRRYLRFAAGSELFEFTCLPFGLSIAPFVFTKIMRQVATYLRKLGVLCVVYLDDWQIFGESEKDCENAVTFTARTLEKIGFTINYNKSQLKPSKQCSFLGLFFDSEKMILGIPSNKREKVSLITQNILNSNRGHVNIRIFAQVLGYLTSICPANKYGWLYTKRLERAKYLALKQNNRNYNGTMLLSQECIDDLKWWSRSVMSCYNNIRSDTFDLIIFSDSSTTGWGAACGEQRTHGWWSQTELTEHINVLELKAAFYALKCFARDRKGCSVLLRVDNPTAIAYIKKMGSVRFPHLSQIARQLCQWCEVRDIWIEASYIPSKDNVVADEESRTLPTVTEWELNSRTFSAIIDVFGVPDIDLFASRANSKCKKYVSWLPDPDSYAVDAFSISWGNYFFYAFPPFILLLRTIRKIISDKSEGILVTPDWPSQPWFPLLQKIAVKPPLRFDFKTALICNLSFRTHPVPPGSFLVAWKVSAKHSN